MTLSTTSQGTWLWHNWSWTATHCPLMTANNKLPEIQTKKAIHLNLVWVLSSLPWRSCYLCLSKQQIYTCTTLFCTFLYRHWTTTTWKCLISLFVEDVNTRQPLSCSFPALGYSPFKFNSIQERSHANIWQNERDGISA